jgi:hypothetical protein
MNKLSLWNYEYPIWIGYFNEKCYFRILPLEIVKIIIDIVIKNIVKKRQELYNLQLVKERITTILYKESTSFHLDYDIDNDIEIERDKFCDIYTAKSILINLSKTLSKPIIFSHICCTGKGLMFKYVNSTNKTDHLNIYSRFSF